VIEEDIMPWGFLAESVEGGKTCLPLIKAPCFNH